MQKTHFKTQTAGDGPRFVLKCAYIHGQSGSSIYCIATIISYGGIIVEDDNERLSPPGEKITILVHPLVQERHAHSLGSLERVWHTVDGIANKPRRVRIHI